MNILPENKRSTYWDFFVTEFTPMLQNEFPRLYKHLFPNDVNYMIPVVHISVIIETIKYDPIGEPDYEVGIQHLKLIMKYMRENKDLEEFWIL